MELKLKGVETKEDIEKYKDYYNVIAVPKIFIPYYNDLSPYQIWKGSRFSAKSFTKATFSLLHAHFDDYYRMIFARKTQKAARDSQFQLFLDQFDLYPVLRKMFVVHKQEMKITSLRTGNYIKGGSFEDSETLMSVPNITDFWAEEPITRKGSIKRDDFQTIAGTLRNTKGIVPRFHFTFNPIGKNNFIYDDFYKNKLYPDFTDLHVNYTDNIYCPDDRIEYLNRLKVVDPQRYLVDGMGIWGEPKNENPFFYNFKRALHVGENLSPLKSHTLRFSFDFNIGSTYAIMYQFIPLPVYKGGGFKIYKTFKGNDTKDVCNKIKNHMGWISGATWSGSRNITITGDSTGKNRTAVAGNTNNYTVILKELRLSKSQLRDVSGVNQRHVHSQTLCNNVFAEIPFNINKDGNNQTISDLTTAIFDDENNNLKKDRKDNPQDAGDTVRYAINEAFPNAIKSVEKYSKIIAPDWLEIFESY